MKLVSQDVLIVVVRAVDWGRVKRASQVCFTRPQSDIYRTTKYVWLARLE